MNYNSLVIETTRVMLYLHYFPPQGISVWISLFFSLFELPLVWRGLGTSPEMTDLESNKHWIGVHTITAKNELLFLNPQLKPFKCQWNWFYYLWFIICNDPGKNRILHQIVVCPSSKSVQMHEVFKITYFASLWKERYSLNTNNCNKILYLKTRTYLLDC